MAENESFFDSKIEKEGACEQLTDESEVEDENQEVKVKDNENKADQDFSDYVQVNALQEEGANVAEQADEPQQQELSQRVTRGAAASRGIEVEDIPLPKHCPTSVRGRR